MHTNTSETAAKRTAIRELAGFPGIGGADIANGVYKSVWWQAPDIRYLGMVIVPALLRL
jgi:hypothetical protein